MFSKKYIFSVIVFTGIIASQFPVFADNISDMKAVLTDTIAKLTQNYEIRIQSLETENTALKQEILNLRGTGTAIIKTPSIIPSINSIVTPVITPTTTKSDIYDAVIKQINGNLGNILRENNLPGYTAIGLFEFIEPNSVFVSFDDGANPLGVTAFKTKILYTFDTNLLFTKIGYFDLDYTSQRYRTTFGSNPYVNSFRTRIKNPNYKGKLLENIGDTNNLSIETKTPLISTINTGTGEVTLAQIKAAYDKTKLLDAIKLSDIYIIKNPNDLDVLRIRYRSYYIIGKYNDSLAEIKKMENIQGSAFERTIACDAAVIGKIAKKTDISAYYSAICKKQ